MSQGVGQGARLRIWGQEFESLRARQIREQFNLLREMSDVLSVVSCFVSDQCPKTPACTSAG
jgi:hypothetical protein